MGEDAKGKSEPPGYFYIIVRSGSSNVPNISILADGIMELGRGSLKTS